MLKNKLIQVRLNDVQFSQIIEKAGAKNQSVSEYARAILLQTEIDTLDVKSETKKDSKISVFQRPEFLKTVIWIYSKKNNMNNNNSIDEAKLIISQIDTFIKDIDLRYMDFFFNVKIDLKRAINNSPQFFGVIYYFDKHYSQVYFNFNEFEKMISNDLK